MAEHRVIEATLVMGCGQRQETRLTASELEHRRSTHAPSLAHLFNQGSRTSGLNSLACFERFTDRARRVVVLAQEESRMLNHNYIGTEHILLGLVHEGKGVAAKALESLGISLEAVRRQVEEIIGQGKAA